MSEIMKGKSETFISVVRKAYKSPNHIFTTDTPFGRVELRLFTLGQNPEAVVHTNDKIRKEIDDGVIRGDDNWIENFAKAGLLEGETQKQFIKRVKSLRVNSPILKLED